MWQKRCCSFPEAWTWVWTWLLLHSQIGTGLHLPTQTLPSPLQPHQPKTYNNEQLATVREITKNNSLYNELQEGAVLNSFYLLSESPSFDMAIHDFISNSDAMR